jgi:phosphate-selective porin OprO/OprP
MHGGTRTWLVLLPAILMTCGGSVMAQEANDSWRSPGNDSAYAVPAEPAYEAANAPIPAQPISADAAPAKDLQARVADLEAALKKAADKEAESKKKAEGMPSVKVGGRIHLDTAMFGQGPASLSPVTGYGDVKDGTEFRRARIGVSGDAFYVVDYKFEMDFADTDLGNGGKLIQSTAFKDVYLGIHELPVLGNIRAGHFKEPFGLEQLESTNFLTFMERSVNDDGAFVPGRRLGIMAFDNYLEERGTWAIGYFASEMVNDAEPPVSNIDEGNNAVTMRGTFLPWYDEGSGGRGLIHTGIAYSYRHTPDNTYRFRSRPEAHLGPYVVDTHNITLAPEVQEIGLELAGVYGPLSVQAEYFNVWVPRTGIGTAYLNGAYAYVSYFLTGENRNYSRTKGTFDRVRPFTNFFRVRTNDGVETGWGAWEVGYRYSYIDLVDLDAGVNGGIANDHTLGVNWYMNPHTRLMFNYVLCHSTNDYGVKPLTDMSVYEMRFQIDF